MKQTKKNDRRQSLNLIKSFLEVNKCDVLPSPAQRQGFNLIECLWRQLKLMVIQRIAKNLQE